MSSFMSFFRQPLDHIVGKLGYGIAVATIVSTLAGHNLWIHDRRLDELQHFKACRLRRKNATADLEMLEREVVSMKQGLQGSDSIDKKGCC